MGIVSDVVEIIGRGVDSWRERDKAQLHEREQMLEAIDLVLQAAIATKAYLHDRAHTKTDDRERERELSYAWHHAAMRVAQYDRDLLTIAQQKAIKWASPGEWAKADVPEGKLKLDLIIAQCNWLRERALAGR